MAKKAAKKKKKVTRRKKNEPTPEEAWNSLKEEVGIDEVESYAMNGTYRVNSAIQHPKFGLGIVTATASNKIDVVFEDGAKSLVHNR